jgi:hypothetical protein
MLASGEQPIVWTAGWTLRNDDSLPIAGDPAAGTVRICLTESFSDAHVPALAMFIDAGILVGELRDKWTQERYRANTVNDHASLVTSEATNLTKDKPCADVRARMFVRDHYTVRTWPASVKHVWDFDHVLGYTVGKLTQPGKLDFIRGQIGLRAAVIADVGNPLSISEADAARNDQDNPLNRIPVEMQLARVAPPNGPDGKGNFRVCLWKDIDDVPDAKADAVTVPPDVIFESYGHLIGDLRDPEPDVDYAMYDNKTSWAVITLNSFTLSKAKPCAIFSVRSVLSDSWPWLFPFVREGDYLRFQALKVKGHVGTEGLEGNLGEAIDAGALNGTPIADIGRPLDLGDQPP